MGCCEGGGVGLDFGGGFLGVDLEDVVDLYLDVVVGVGFEDIVVFGGGEYDLVCYL